MRNIYSNATVNVCIGFIAKSGQTAVQLTNSLHLYLALTSTLWNHYDMEASASRSFQKCRGAERCSWWRQHQDNLYEMSFISSYVPSPSSLMDLGSETAKHCIVSYFCCWGSCSCGSSWFSLWGLTSIRQLNVWLFLLGPSLDHGTPFTADRERSADEAFSMWLPVNFIATRYYTTGRPRKCTEEAREETILQVKDMKRARGRKSEKVVAG